MPKLRAKTVRMVRSEGKSVSEVARYLGCTKSTVSKWCAKAPPGGVSEIPTESSRPHHHPKQLDEDSRIYVYTLIDLHSRWTYARAMKKMGSKQTVPFVKTARKKFSL